MEIKFDKNQMKKMFEKIEFEVEKEVHTALYQGGKDVQKFVANEAKKLDSFQLTKATKERYRWRVKNKRRKDGKYYGSRNNYQLDVEDIHFTTKKVRHKFGNGWLRVHLRVNSDTNEATDKYWSFIKGFYSNFRGNERKQETTGKKVGKLKKYDFFTEATSSHMETLIKRLNNMKF